MIVEYNLAYVERWLRGTTEHCMRVEFFLNELSIHGTDLERPHDIVGEGNKFEKDIVLGMATQYREKRNILLTEAIERHRKQFHHRVWGIEKATQDDKIIAVIDAICASLESQIYRPYQEEHGWYEILSRIKYQKSGEVKRLFTEITREMIKIGEPEVKIPHLNNLVNPNLDHEVFNKIRERLNETLREFVLI